MERKRRKSTSYTGNFHGITTALLHNNSGLIVGRNDFYAILAGLSKAGHIFYDNGNR